MPFDAQQIYPIDFNNSAAVGVDIPFSGPGVFTPNYTTAAAIKNNLINYFLTNPGERPGNPTFGGGLRAFIFSSISDDNLEFLQEDVSQKIASQFPNVSVKNLEVLANTDNNEVVVQIYYTVVNTSIEGELVLNFT